ncbi:Predicted PurR-regulated permease PerM [Halogranum amylolyticum]|uniref:Predicted PurR-regulated permease PerM n=1 Tax=Halogranum amylolyticum TaxID=660520 RepID=A0A1H8RIT7_9EURY|nr:AI-2E family transporter [Halogranum amylolyticum]SEO66167.1 Predicted PurR-regulated permease PerM [Halogranum amylolyticum]
MALDFEERIRLVWIALGVVCAFVLLYAVSTFVGTFVFGVFVYYAVRPIHNRLRQRVSPPSLAAFLSMFLLVLPALLVVFATLGIAVQELSRFLSNQELSGLEALLAPYIDSALTETDLQALLAGNVDAATLEQSLSVATQSVSFVGLGVLHLFVMLALAFYLLRDGSRLAALCYNCVPDETFAAYGRAVDTDLKNVYFGNIANAVFTGTIGAITYTGLNFVAPAGVSIPYPALLGLLTGVASLVPVVGMKLVYFPVAAYLAGRAVFLGQTEALWFVLAFAALSLVVVDTIPDVVLRPFVSGGTLHSGTLMLTYILGSLLFGWYGIFLAPLLLVVIVEFVRIALPTLYDSWGDGVDTGQTTFAGTDWTTGRPETTVESTDGGRESGSSDP